MLVLLLWIPIILSTLSVAAICVKIFLNIRNYRRKNAAPIKHFPAYYEPVQPGRYTEIIYTLHLPSDEPQANIPAIETKPSSHLD